jgi:hypothetical protein
MSDTLLEERLASLEARVDILQRRVSTADNREYEAALKQERTAKDHNRRLRKLDDIERERRR